jgi:hypothetical protein
VTIPFATMRAPDSLGKPISWTASVMESKTRTFLVTMLTGQASRRSGRVESRQGRLRDEGGGRGSVKRDLL